MLSIDTFFSINRIISNNRILHMNKNFPIDRIFSIHRIFSIDRIFLTISLYSEKRRYKKQTTLQSTAWTLNGRQVPSGATTTVKN